MPFPRIGRRRCAPLFKLSDALATLGSDIELVCIEGRGAAQPMQRLVLDHEQLRALIPVLAEHLSAMIVFRGNLSSEDGHYQALRKIEGHVFLLDSLQDGPQWLPDPEQYFAELLDNPGKLVGAMPPACAPVLERYGVFLSRTAKQDVARGLGDLYGVQPIVPLEEYFRSQRMEEASATQLAAYFHWQGMPAQSREWVFDDLLPLRNIDVTLGAAGSGQQRVLLTTRTHPYLIPAYFSAAEGAWQARAPTADGSRMETRLLQAVMDAQQVDYDQLHAQVSSDARRQEIALQRRGLGAVWLQDWPLEWPPVSVPAPSTAAPHVPGKARIESGKQGTSRKQAGTVPCPWEPGHIYTVTGVVTHVLCKTMFGNRWGTQELVRHGIELKTEGLRNLSEACDKVPGRHLSEGVFVHDGVELENGTARRKVKVYRKLNHENDVLNIGIPIVGEVNLENFVSGVTKRNKEATGTNSTISSDATIHFNTEYLVRERMFGPVQTLYPLMGSKRDIVQFEPSGTVLGALYAALNAPGVSSVVDAFAGTGFLALWVASQQRRGLARRDLRLVMNEWDQYRHNTLKTVQQHPEQVKKALGDLMQRIKHLYYRAFHNHPITEIVDGHGIGNPDEARARRLAEQAGLPVSSMTARELITFLNDTVEAWVKTAEIDQSTNTATLSRALKDYIVGHITCPLPPESENQDENDIRLRASNAALYLVAQHNGHIASSPINFSRPEVFHPQRHRSGISLGVKGSILNKMLDRTARVIHAASNHSQGRPAVSKLSMDLNFRPGSDSKDSMFHNLPLYIDQVSDALTGVDIRRGDGWELLRNAQKDAFALIDPPYWGVKDVNRTARLKVYSSGSSEEYTKQCFLNMVDQYGMPAWQEKGVRVMLFNRLDGEIANAMESRGFNVTALSNLSRMNVNNSSLTEFVAVNFHIDSNATLRPFVTHSSPAAPLEAPSEASSEDESDAMP